MAQALLDTAFRQAGGLSARAVIRDPHGSAHHHRPIHHRNDPGGARCRGDPVPRPGSPLDRLLALSKEGQAQMPRQPFRPFARYCRWQQRELPRSLQIDQNPDQLRCYTSWPTLSPGLFSNGRRETPKMSMDTRHAITERGCSLPSVARSRRIRRDTSRSRHRAGASRLGLGVTRWTWADPASQ